MATTAKPNYSEQPLCVTLKIPGRDEPWVVVRATDPKELATLLKDLTESSAFADIGKAQSTLLAQYSLGKHLDATAAGTVTNKTETPEAVVAPQEAPQQPEAPAPQPQAPQPAAPQQGLAVGGLAQAPAPTASWGAAPQAQPSSLFSPGPALPGAPMILGQPAVLREGQSERGGWRAWADPRPDSVLSQIPADENGQIPSTNDPNDPRLAAGQARFWAFFG